MRLDPTQCDEAAISRMVHMFYGRVLDDGLLGPVFGRHVRDWPVHLSKMVDFWSSVLLGTKRYRGVPMPVHQALPELCPQLFARWLELFRDTTAEVCSPPMRERADLLAERIAQSLWLGHQMVHAPQDLTRGSSQPARGKPLPLAIREVDAS
jgi:hemoglobin